MPDPMMSPTRRTAQTVPPGALDRDNLKAILWLLMSVVASSAMTVAVRLLSGDIAPPMIVFLRFALTLIVLAAALVGLRRLRRSLRFTLRRQHLLRGLLMGISTHLGFYAIAKMELVTVTVLFFMVPIFATALSGVIHGEHAGPRRLAAIAFSFVGVLMVLKPGLIPIGPAVFAALASSLFFAAALVMSRELASADGPLSVLVSSAVITCLISVPLAIPVWELPGSASVWAIVALLVITGFLRLLGDIQAYRYGEASVLAPITYLRLVFIGSAGYWMFAEVPDNIALMGAAIIIGSAIYIARREAQIKKQTLTEARK